MTSRINKCLCLLPEAIEILRERAYEERLSMSRYVENLILDSKRNDDKATSTPTQK